MTGLLAAAAVFLAVAGLAKLRQPAATAAALRAARIPIVSSGARPALIRLVGLAEFLVAAGVIAVGGPFAPALLAIAFAALAMVSWRLVRVAPEQSCGCFGNSAGAASHWHTAVNAICTAIGVTGALRAGPGAADALLHQGWLGLPIVVASLLLAWLGYLTITALPDLGTARAQLLAPR